MKITKRQLRRIIKEARFGMQMPRGSQPPLDVPMRDSGLVPKDQLRKLADIFMKVMGMSADEVLQKPEFVEQGITDLLQLDERKMQITERQLRRIIEQAVIDKTVPGHFGSGENIDVYGYDTKHFDICGSAVELFEDDLSDAKFPGTKKIIIEAAKLADKIFAIEKRVVARGYSESEECEEAQELHDEFKDAIKDVLVKDYSDMIGFMNMHVREITKREE